jgi:uncharacterized protein YndB with AHSA1/START domain
MTGSRLVIALVLYGGVASAQEVKNTSYTLSSGERILRHEAVVEAPLDTVWRTLTTTDGLRSFLAPVVAIDLRVGGRWEASYNSTRQLGDSANIVNEVVTYLPPEMLTVRVIHTPPSFLHPDVAKSLWTVYQLQSVTERQTRVVVSMVGWKAGPDWDAVYRFFDRGNAFAMAELQRRFTNGPHRW